MSLSSLAMLTDLPLEVVVIILRCLRKGDLCSLALVNKAHRRITNEAWRIICRRESLPLIRNFSSIPRHLILPFKESFIASKQWEQASFSSRRIAKFARPSLPKLKMQGNSNGVYYCHGGSLSSVDFGENSRERLLLSSNYLSDIFDFGIIEKENRAMVSDGYCCTIWDLKTKKCIFTRPIDRECCTIETDLTNWKWWIANHSGRITSLDVRNPRKAYQHQALSQRIWTLKVHQGFYAAGVFGKDPLQVFDAETGIRIGPTRAHRQSVYGIHFNDCNILSSSSFDGTASIWDLRLSNPGVFSVDDPGDEPLYCVQYDGYWKMITGTARFGLCRIWDVRNRKWNDVFETAVTSSPVYNLAFDDRNLCVGLSSGIQLFSLSSS